MNTERDNVKTGLFVLLGLVMGVAVILTLAEFDAWFARRQQVRLYYSLSDGLQGLKEGAEVTLGGQPIGGVVAIEDFVPPGHSDIHGKIITFEIPEEIQLHWDARIELQVPTFGSNTSLNIASVGAAPQMYASKEDIPDDVYRAAFPEYRSALADDAPMRPLPTGAIPGRISGNPLARDFVGGIGIGDLQRRQIAQIVENIAAVTADVARLAAHDGDEDSTLTGTVRNIHTMTARLRDDLPELTGSAKRSMARIEKILDDTDASMADVKATVTDVREYVADIRKRSELWMARLDSITESTDEGLADLRRLIKEKGPEVARAIDNIQQLTKTANEKTMVQVETALSAAIDALGHFRDAGKQVKGLVVGQTPVLERAFANAELTTAQLKLAAVEVRRSPWRLLYTPSETEVEADNLYDAARSFAQAASSLDAASRSLEALARQAPDNREQLQEMLGRLQQLFDRYRVAEDRFWQALEERPPSR